MKVLLVTLAIFAAAHAATVPTTAKPAIVEESLPSTPLTVDVVNATDAPEPIPTTPKPSIPTPTPHPSTHQRTGARDLVYYLDGYYGDRSSYATYSSYYPRYYDYNYVPQQQRYVGDQSVIYY